MKIWTSCGFCCFFFFWLLHVWRLKSYSGYVTAEIFSSCMFSERNSSSHYYVKYFKTISNICIKSKCNLVLYVVVLHVFHKFYIVASLLSNVKNLFPKDKSKTVVELLVKKVLPILILYRCLQKLRFWTIFRTVYSCHMFASKQYFG